VACADGHAGDSIDIPDTSAAMAQYHLVRTGDNSRIEEVVGRCQGKGEPCGCPRLGAFTVAEYST